MPNMVDENVLQNNDCDSRSFTIDCAARFSYRLSKFTMYNMPFLFDCSF